MIYRVVISQKVVSTDKVELIASSFEFSNSFILVERREMDLVLI